MDGYWKERSKEERKEEIRKVEKMKGYREGPKI